MMACALSIAQPTALAPCGGGGGGSSKSIPRNLPKLRSPMVSGNSSVATTVLRMQNSPRRRGSLRALQCVTRRQDEKSRCRCQGCAGQFRSLLRERRQIRQEFGESPPISHYI
ncbi:unnamed protein product [Triticum turgidum subsp. durum]|uniref:Uncharacterized protein n=1 Tax=Triticum turgidum subsp. durum TaxID=4567 RepID=A0A9R1S4L3_TRITD|nr:unnamed protein product [Triticum turgidum subsp. durum]